MAFTLASSGGNSAGASSAPLTVTAAQGTLIVITAFGVATGNVAVSLTSVTDNTSGGNTYSNIPAVASSAFFATPNQTSTQVTVWCLVQNALSASTITVAFSGATFVIASYTVWSGIPAGTTVLSTALTPSILAHVSSQAVPAALSPAGGLAIANVNLNGAVSSFSGGYTVVAPEANMGYLVTSASGLTSTTATFAGASDTWAASNVVFGAPPSSAPLPAAAPGWFPGAPGMPAWTPFESWPPPWAVSPAGAASIAVAESGSAAEDLAVAAAVPLAETGSSAETLAVSAAVALAEAGSAAETLAAAASLSLAEAGSASDALAVSAAVALAEAGSGADAAQVTAAVPLAETGTAAEALTAGVAISLAETGSAADALSVSTGAATQNASSTPLVTAVDTSAPAVSGSLSGALVAARSTSSPGVSDG